jgi:GT2 family glycosyltransferase
MELPAGGLVFSIVVPTYRRPRPLGACLEALARLDYPRGRFEVIVSDDGGEEPLHAAVGRVGTRLDVTLLCGPHAGAGAARNAGAARARGRLLAFTDDDCAPAPDWLAKLEARLATNPTRAMVGGRTLNALHANPYATASQLVVDAGYAHLNRDPEHARFFTASNLALPAEDFRALGGFDARFVASEDRELCGRWESSGGRMIYAPEAVVHHAHELGWRSFWRQHFNYGRGALLLQRARARHGWPHFRPDPRYYASLLSRPFSETSFASALGLSALLLVSQSASATGMLAEWLRQRRTGGEAL